MQKKSLLTEAREPAAKSPAAKTTEMTLAFAPRGNGVLERILGGPLATPPYVSAGSTTPYLSFYHAIAGAAERIKKAKPAVREGDLVLAADGEYQILHSPVPMFLVRGHQHWAERVPATQQLLKADLQPQGRGSSLKEEIEALVLVLAGGELVPATWRTKGAACRGPVLALDESIAAATPEWLARSEAHKLTAEIPFPWARFVVEIDYRLETSRNGNEYVVTGAECRPLDPDTFARLGDFLSNPDCLRLLEETSLEHERKVAEVTAKLAA